MRRNDLDLQLYLARLAGAINAQARRRWIRSLLVVRPFRTPADLPVAIARDPMAVGPCATRGAHRHE